MARTISHAFASLSREILFLPLEHKTQIFSPPCNILYIYDANTWISCIRTVDWNKCVWSSQFWTGISWPLRCRRVQCLTGIAGRAQGPDHRPQAWIFQAFPVFTVALKTAWVIHINFTKSSVVWCTEKKIGALLLVTKPPIFDCARHFCFFAFPEYVQTKFKA